MPKAMICAHPSKEAYDKAMADGRAIINGIDAPEKALEALNAIRGLTRADQPEGAGRRL